MATKVILPKLGQTMEEGTIVEWLKREGDAVERGEILFQVESDKAVLEVESRGKGVLRKILVDKGVKVPVLTPVGIVAGPDEDISGLLAEAPAGGAPAAAAPATAPPAAAELPEAAWLTPIERPGGRLFASPRARKVASEKGVDLAYVQGSGPEGRIIEKDVLAFLEAQPLATPLARRVAADMGVPLAGVPSAGARVTAADVRAAAAPAPAVAAPMAPLPPVEGALTPLSGLRAIIAERMATSAHTTAAVTLESLVDATELVALREKVKAALQDELGFAVSYNDILGMIVARCLIEFPYMNVRLEEGGIRQRTEVNIGVAVDSPRGLLVPVVRNVDKMGLKELARTARDLVQRARDGKAQIDELSGGSLTITNLGMFGVDAFTPIINLPECAILGVGRIKPEPAVVGGQIVVRQKMWLSLTFDHRLVDGAPAARFLQGIMRYIEDPYLLLT
ncbi:MAG: 2-oxo acid dehydrogenase subunit E2 [Chloroflexi bacterium]|nr:2-oxo acid dehydrogenase subunit E2 [Chloroflexota bacterium]